MKKPKPEAKVEKVSDLQAMWLEEIDRYETDSDPWVRKARKVVKRYRDTREHYDSSIRYNILWSNIQVLKPALYSQEPTPRVERRFKDNNPVAKTAADLLERCLRYAIDCTKYGMVMRQTVQDRLLAGRGTSWVRYVPHFRDKAVEPSAEGPQITDDQNQPEQELYYEEAVPDFVHWEDFGHTFARTWEECRAVWRIAYLTRDELNDRFGKDLGRQIPLDYKPWDERKNEAKVTESMQRACIYEIWDKQTKQVIWVSKGMQKELDVRDDPLGLEDFFPCPTPMFANLANDTLIPTPDYLQYQDQAMELDELTSRVANIAKGIKVAGVYDKQAEGIQRIFTEGVEFKLVGIDQWSRFAERGGLESAMDLLPTQEMAQTLLAIYEAREKTKADLYEITGISDIIRGFSSGGSKTATEQQIKSQFANLRLSEQQREVQTFARDLLKIMGEIIAFKFSPDTIMRISGVKLLGQQEKQQLQMVMQQAQMTGQQPNLPPDVMQAMQQPSLEEVMQLLRNHNEFGFSIEIETDSTINTDLQYAREQSNEMIQAVGAGAQGIGTAVQLGLMSPQAGQAVLKATIKTHHLTKDVEDALDIQPQPQQQGMNPEAMKQMEQAQAQIQQQGQKLQQKEATLKDLEGKVTQRAMQHEYDKATFEVQKDHAAKSLDMERSQFEADKKAATDQLKIMIDGALAKIGTLAEGFQVKQATTAKQDEDGKGKAESAKAQASMAEFTGKVSKALIDGLQTVAAQLNQPKQVVRGPDGRVAGIEPVKGKIQ